MSQAALDLHLLKGDRFLDFYHVEEYKVALIIESNPAQKTFKIRLDGFQYRHDEVRPPLSRLSSKEIPGTSDLENIRMDIRALSKHRIETTGPSR